MDAMGIREAAEQAIAQGQFETAIALYQDQVPADPSCIWSLGLAYLLQGEEAAAQAVWMEAIAALSPEEMGETLAALGARLLAEADRQLQSRRFEAAEYAYRQGLELESDAASALVGLGRAIAQQGRYDEACDCWQQAVVLDPQRIEAYQLQGQTYQFLRDWAAAIEAYQALLHQAPEQGAIHHRLGQCLLRLGDKAGAMAHLQAAFHLQPQHPAIRGDLGWAWLQSGDVSTALQSWHQTLAQIPTFVSDYLAWESQLQMQRRSTQDLYLNRLLVGAIARQDTPAALQALCKRLQQMGWKGTATNLATSEPELAALQGLSPTPSPEPLASTSSEPVDMAGVPGPIGFYETTEAWANKTPGASYQLLHPASVLPLRPPQSLDADIHPSFRFGSKIPLPGSFVATIPNGRYWIEETAQVAAIAPDNQILGDVSPFSPILSPGHPDAHPRHHPLLGRPHLPPPRVLNGRVAILSGLSNGVYFHWMLDLLPRIELLHQAGMTPDSVDYYLVDATYPFQRETLERLGIPLHKTLSPAQVPHLEARSLLLPSFPASISWMPEWTCDFLQRSFLPADCPPSRPHRRLYISRARASVRRLINEDQVVQALLPWGFERVYLETLSVQEQATLFAEAEAVVALHGSGLTNLVFCQPGTTVIELFSPEYVYPCYWLLANWRQLRYYYGLGAVPEGPFFHRMLYPDARQEDVWVDVDHLLDLLGHLSR